MTTRSRVFGVGSQRFRRFACLVLLATGTALSAQDQPPSRPTFRTETNAVVVDARVVDRSGRFIRDLTKDEFKVFEDGREQTISTFELVDLPFEPLPSRSVAEVPIPSDVTSNVDAENGRLYVIVLDDYNPPPPIIRSTMGQSSGGAGSGGARPLFPAQEIARELIFHMSEGDRAAVVTTAGRREMAQEFTNDRGRLLADVDRYVIGRGQTDVPMGLAGGAVSNPFRPVHDVMLTLKDIATWLSGVPARRKALVLISARMGGVSARLSLTNFSRDAGLQNVSLAADMRDLVEATSRANVSIYTLSPLTAPSIGFRLPLPDEYVLARADNDPEKNRVTIAQATGGFSRALDFNGVFERIASENGSYYLLGYTSPNSKTDGKFHRIEVRTTREDLGIRARSGYYGKSAAPALKKSMTPSDLPSELVTALQSPASIAGLPMSMSVVAYRGNGSKALVSIAIHMDADDESVTDAATDGVADGAMSPAKAIEVAIAAAKVDGKVDDLRSITVPGGTIVSRMELDPGRYHVRVAGLDTAGNRRGSLLYDVDVPDFSKGPLTMSGVVLATPEHPTTSPAVRWVSGSDERWKETLGLPPTTRRVFTAEDELTDYVEIYDNDRREDHQVDVTTTVCNEEGDVLFTQQETWSVEPANGATAPHQIKTTIPLENLEPGAYVLTVLAKRNGSAAQPTSRRIPFDVRPPS